MSIPFDKALDAVVGANDSRQRYPLKMGMKLVPHDDSRTAAKHTPKTFPELYCATEDMDRSKVHSYRPAIRREQDGKEIAIITVSGYQIGTDPSLLDYVELFIAAPETARQRDLLIEALVALLGDEPVVQGGICQRCGRDYVSEYLTGDCGADDCPETIGRKALAACGVK
jgi:hypothetical protein